MWPSFPLIFQGNCKSTNNSITFLSITLSHEKWLENNWKGKKHSSKNLHKEFCYSIESSIESDLVEKGKKGHIRLDIVSLNINAILKNFEHLKKFFKELSMLLVLTETKFNSVFSDGQNVFESHFVHREKRIRSVFPYILGRIYEENL